MRLSSFVGAAVLAAFCTTAAQPVQAQVQISGVTLNNPKLKNGVLTAPTGTASGSLLGLPFTTNIQHFALDLTPAQGACPILNLELAPIHLQLLGLHVDTSRICLTITGENKGLLGPLLCNLARSNSLDNLLTGLLGGGGGGLLGDILEGVLNNVLTNQPGPGPGAGAGNNGNGNNGNGNVCRGQCEVLHLVLGPVDLNIPLLGLDVMLDNCNGGPVEVCISATASQGILGQLLCGLVNGNLLGNINLANLTHFIDAALAALPGGLSTQEIIGLLGTLGLSPQQITGLLGILGL